MLTPDDLLTIATGGAKITREEGRRILADARELVVVLARDIIG